MNLTCFQVSSRDLVKNLSGCSQVLLFAATLGMGPDQQIQKYSRLETSRAVILQAAAAALIESVCDEKNEELRLYYEGEGYFLRPRFSPGYGDFSISYQRDLLDALQASKFAWYHSDRGVFNDAFQISDGGYRGQQNVLSPCFNGQGL